MKFQLATRVDADPEEIWGVLADFGNIGVWNTGISGSHIVGGPNQGLGAERQCDFEGGYLREKIVAWQEGKEFTIWFTHMPAPIRNVSARFSLDAKTVFVEYHWTPKWFAIPMVPVIQSMLKKAMRGVLRDLKIHMES